MASISNLVSGLQYKGPTQPKGLPAGTKIWGSQKRVQSASPVMSKPTPNMSTPMGPKFGGAIQGVVPPSVKAASPSVAPSTVPKAPQAVSTSFAPTPNTRGLLAPTPDSLAAVRGGLLDIQSKLGELQKQKEQPFSSQNPSSYGNIFTSLAEKSTQPSASAVEAQKAYQDAVKMRQEFERGLSDEFAANALNAIPLSFRQGRQQVIQQANAEKLAAIQGAVSSAQTGIGLGQKQQEIEQSALSSAASLVPEALRYGAFGDASLSPQNRAQEVAQQVRSNLITPEKAEQIMTSLYGGAGATFLNQALQGTGGYNYITGSAQAQALGQNVLAGGVAGREAAQNVFSQSYADYENVRNAVANVDGLAQLLIQSTGGINPFGVRFADETLSSFKRNLSSSQQAVYDNTLESLRSRVSGLLQVGSGQIPTDISSAANKILDGSLQMKDLAKLLQRIEQEGHLLLENQGRIVNENYARLQGGGSPAAPSSGTAGIGDSWDTL